MSQGARRASARLAAGSAVKIRAALRTSVDSEKIVAGYYATHPTVGEFISEDRARARAWAMLNSSLNMDAFKLSLRKVYADFYALGANESSELLINSMRSKKSLTKAGPISSTIVSADGKPVSPTFSIDWANWTPGNEAAALLLRQPGGLKKLLGNIDITAKGIADTSHNLLGNALADGIALGKTPTQIAADIEDSLSAPERALTIAITEGQRAKIEANVQSYADNGVEETEWTVNSPDDADCLDNAGEIRKLGDEFPSGDTQPPVHPNCQCDLLPVMPDMSAFAQDQTDTADNTDMAVVADIAKYNPDQERDERGRFGSGSVTSGTADRHGAEAAVHAANLYSRSSQIEPRVTASMRDLASKYGTKLEGLRYRLKAQDSLARKIADDAKQDKISMGEASRNISDANRYTMVANPEDYRAKAESVEKDLRSQGYDVRVKNYWQEGSNYKGINMALTDHEGNKIELQLHTPESLSMKETSNHPLYEEYRAIDKTSARGVELNNQMVANSATLSTPPNLEGYGVPKIGKSLDNRLQVYYYRSEGGL